MATRSRYKPDESSCNHLLVGKQLLLAGYELQLKLLKTWHFLSVGNASVKKSLVLRFSLKTTFLYLCFPLKGNTTFFNTGFSQKEHLTVLGEVPTEDGVPTPPSVQGLPGLDQKLGELCPLPCLCTWCRKLWALRLLTEFGLSDSWLQGRESGSLWPIADWPEMIKCVILLRWKTNRRVVFLGNLPARHSFGRIMASWKCGEELHLVLQKYINLFLIHPWAACLF